jgi:hypothetical protein
MPLSCGLKRLQLESWKGKVRGPSSRSFRLATVAHHPAIILDKSHEMEVALGNRKANGTSTGAIPQPSTKYVPLSSHPLTPPDVFFGERYMKCYSIEAGAPKPHRAHALHIDQVQALSIALYSPPPSSDPFFSLKIFLFTLISPETNHQFVPKLFSRLPQPWDTLPRTGRPSTRSVFLL